MEKRLLQVSEEQSCGWQTSADIGGHRTIASSNVVERVKIDPNCKVLI